MISIQPEIRITKWFGLGLDFGLGGVGGTSNWAKRTPHPKNHIKTIAFDIFMTTKFIAALDTWDIWGDIGFGLEGLHGNIVLDDAEWHSQIFQFAARARIGATYKFNKNMGVGIHFAYIYRILVDSSFETGLHFTYYFGEFNKS